MCVSSSRIEIIYRAVVTGIKCISGIVTRSFLSIPILIYLSQGAAETYYIDAIDGDDVNSGVVDPVTGMINAWRTLDRAFSFSNIPGFNPGDSILLKRGQDHYGGNAERGSTGRYLESFGTSGSAGLPIIFDAYGVIEYDGLGRDINKPVVRLQVTKVDISEWVEATETGEDGVWKLNRQTFNTTDLWEDDIRLKECADERCRDGGNWYHFSEGCDGCIHWNTLYYKPTSGNLANHVVHYGRFGRMIFNDRSYITIRNIEFRTSNWPIQFRADSKAISDVIVEGCSFYGTGYGPHFEARNNRIDRIKILNNRMDRILRAVSIVSGEGCHGINDVEIAYNVIEDVNIDGVWEGDQETVYMQRTSNSFVHHNRIRNGQTTGIAMWSSGCCTLRNNIIEYNEISGLHGADEYAVRGWNMGSGPETDTCYGNIIRYNLVYDNDIGLLPANCNVIDKEPNLIYNNTLVDNGINLFIRRGAKDWVVKSNINAYPRPTKNITRALHIEHEGAVASIISDLNIYYPAIGNMFKLCCKTMNFDEWKQATQLDNGSLLANPRFIDYQLKNYDIARKSPAIDFAENFGQTMDISGVSIFKNPDAGAYEYRPGEYDLDESDIAQLSINIKSPLDGSIFNSSEYITFTGSTYDSNERDLSDYINWNSSIDGFMGQGDKLVMRLSPGEHVVTAMVTDSDGSSISQAVDIFVEDIMNDGVSLLAHGFKEKGLHTVDLNWYGTTADSVVIYRNGVMLVTVADNGTYTDHIGTKGKATYNYQVCEEPSVACSNVETVDY